MASLEYGGELSFVDETAVKAFPNNEPEFVALPAVRAVAMLLTPTCNLEEDYWLFSPLIDLKDNPQLKRDTLFSTTGGYADNFGVYAIDSAKLGETFVSFHFTVSVPSQPFRRPNDAERIATLGKEAQDWLADKFARFGGRGWGYAGGDEIIETEGYYHCRICARFYGLEHPVVYLRKGDKPPVCSDCKATSSRQAGSWEQLLKHKRSRKPALDPQSIKTSESGAGKIWDRLRSWKGDSSK